MFSDFLHLKYSDSRTLVHIGKSENVYSDGKYSLKITVSNSPCKYATKLGRFYSCIASACKRLNESGAKMFRIRDESPKISSSINLVFKA